MDHELKEISEPKLKILVLKLFGYWLLYNYKFTVQRAQVVYEQIYPKRAQPSKQQVDNKDKLLSIVGKNIILKKRTETSASFLTLFQ